MIVDTGVLLAAADRADPDHAACADLLRRRDLKVLTEPILVETDHLILRRLGLSAELAFLRSILGAGFAIEVPTRSDRERAVELAERYGDARLGYADGVTVAIAERLDEDTIATLDRRHFSAVRPTHTPAFTIVP